MALSPWLSRSFMVKRSAHNGHYIGSTPFGNSPFRPCGGMVDTVHLGCKRWGFKSPQGHSGQVAEWFIAMVLKTVGLSPRGSNPLLPSLMLGLNWHWGK